MGERGGKVVRHNHTTRDIKPPHECPACDRLHGCRCPRGDYPAGRLDGFDMGVVRDGCLEHLPECPVHGPEGQERRMSQRVCGGENCTDPDCPLTHDYPAASQERAR